MCIRDRYLSIFLTSSRVSFEWRASCSLERLCSHFTYGSSVFSLYSLKLMRLIHCNNVLVRYCSRLSERTSITFRILRISHVEFRFPGSEKPGPSRNGRMERNFPVIPIFRNFRPTSRGTPKISEWNSGKFLFHSLPNPEFPEFLVEWKAPNKSHFPNQLIDRRD